MTEIKNFSSSIVASRPRPGLYATLFAFLFSALIALGCPHSPPSPTPPAGVLRVGTSGDYPPFSDWPAGRAAPSGFSTEVALAFARATNRRIEWVPFSWPSLAADLEGGRFDVAFSGVTVRSDRAIRGRFSLPLTTSGAVALVLAKGPLESARDLDQPERRIAVNAGGHLERTSRTLFEAAQIEPVPDNARVLDRLGRDGIHAVMTDTLEAPIWQARREGLRAIGPLTEDRKAAWFPIGHEAEVRRFDAWLLSAEASGALAAMREDHGLPESSTASPIPALLASLDERLSLMIPVARTKWARGLEVTDSAREARVLEAAVAAVLARAHEAASEPPSEDAIRALYRAQIEAAKWIQTEWIRAQPATARPSQSPAEATAALDERIRPALLFLGDRIARLIVHARASAASPPSRDELARAISRHRLPDSHTSAIADALSQVLDARPSVPEPAESPSAAQDPAREHADQHGERQT